MVMIVFYIDDILIFYHKRHLTKVEALIKEIKVAYKLEDYRIVEWFLSIRIIWDKAAKTITLTYDAYIEKIIIRFKLINNAYILNILLLFIRLEKNLRTTFKAEIKAYQKRIDSILYIVIILRLNIAFAISILSYFLTNLSKTYFIAAA